MGKVQLDLARAAFLQNAVDLKALGFSESIDVVDNLAVFIHCRQTVDLFDCGPSA